MERCNECKKEITYASDSMLGLCYKCHKDLFEDAKIPEPDFVLENETAKITIKNDGTVAMNGVLYISKPKQYKINPDCRYGLDYERLIEFVIANMVVTDQSVGFDKVKYMFKEVE